MDKLIGTTIVGVKRNGKTAIGGDSQATMGNMILKDSVLKVRKIYDDKVIVGFAGTVSDAFAMFRKIEGNLQKYSGNLERAVVEIAKEWQNVDSPVRRVEASLLIANKDKLYLVMGDGNVVEPTEDFISIGSGSVFALGAAKALLENTDLPAKEIVKKSLLIASQYCIYTNDHLNIEEVEWYGTTNTKRNCSRIR